MAGFNSFINVAMDAQQALEAEMTDTKTSETELAKKVTNAVLGVLARGEDNLAIYRAVETALRTPAPIADGGVREAAITTNDRKLVEIITYRGIDYALEQLCSTLGVDPDSVNWDVSTETVDGDVRSVIGNIMRAKYGEDFDSPALASPSAMPDREKIATEALANCLDCVVAAEAEGLHEVMEELRGFSEQSDRLIDLVERRLMWVRNYAEPALLSAPQVATEREKIAELENALRPFVDMTTFSGCEAAKLIDKNYGGLKPIITTVTKFQFIAAHRALAQPRSEGRS